MAKVKKTKTKKPNNQSTETLEITRRSIRTTGKRNALVVVAGIVIIGFTLIVANYGKPTITASVSGNNGTAIGQARDVTINNGNKESK